MILKAGQEPNSPEYKKVSEGFSYNSRDNKNFLSVDEIKNLLFKNNFI